MLDILSSSTLLSLNAYLSYLFALWWREKNGKRIFELLICPFGGEKRMATMSHSYRSWYNYFLRDNAAPCLLRLLVLEKRYRYIKLIRSQRNTVCMCGHQVRPSTWLTWDITRQRSLISSTFTSSKTDRLHGSNIKHNYNVYIS